MDKEEQFRNIVKWRTRPKRAKAVKLGDTVKQYMDGGILPIQEKFGPIVELWSQLLPSELCQHSRIADITGGRLKIMVDSPSYMHELRLCSGQLLEQIQQRCPRARITKIDIVPC